LYSHNKPQLVQKANTLKPTSTNVSLKLRVVRRIVLAEQKLPSNSEKTIRIAQYLVGDDSASIILQLQNGKLNDFYFSIIIIILKCIYCVFFRTN
jgi:hypothetical protein